MTGEGLQAHYDCWADTIGAITVVIPCDLCYLGRPHGETTPAMDWVEKWTRQPIPAVFLSEAPNTEIGYWAGMHELGHLMTQRTKNGRQWRRDWSTRRAEAEAWRWALAHSAVEPTPAVWEYITYALESYIWKTKHDPTFYRLLLEATMKGSEE
jgi:hypothetical protein